MPGRSRVPWCPQHPLLSNGTARPRNGLTRYLASRRWRSTPDMPTSPPRRTSGRMS